MKRALLLAITAGFVCVGTAAAQTEPEKIPAPKEKATAQESGPIACVLPGEPYMVHTPRHMYFPDPDPCKPCVWVSAEALYWWVKNAPLPPALVTQGSLTDPIPGFPGQPGTVVLSPDHVDYNGFFGGRVTAGGWIHDSNTGLEISAFALESRSGGFRAASDANGNPPLTLPAIDATTGQPASVLISAPGIASGSLQVTTSLRLWGVEGNVICRLVERKCWDLDFFTGIRYLDLSENLHIAGAATLIGETTGTILSDDNFHTRNQFYGGTVGMRGEWRHCCGLFVGVSARVSVGDMRQLSEISGSSSVNITTPPPPPPVNPGLFATPSNIGRYDRNVFAVVPEAQFKIGYDICKHVRAFAGYDFLYVSNVLRPGDQIDRTINFTQLNGGLVGPARPTATFHSNDFWTQGVSFGIEFRY